MQDSTYKEALRQFATSGGQGTLHKYGVGYYKRISKLGVEAKRKLASEIPLDKPTSR